MLVHEYGIAFNVRFGRINRLTGELGPGIKYDLFCLLVKDIKYMSGVYD